MSDLFDFHNLPGKLFVKVIPKAKFDRIKKEISADGSEIYKVYVTAPAEDGKANEAVIKLLANSLRLAKSSLTITRGHTSREKVIEIKSNKLKEN